jgi:hypothetical protein
MKILGVRWFAGRNCVGIVQYIEDEEVSVYRQTGDADYKYYIGVGNGRDEKEDMQTIADWGSTFDKAAGDVLFNVIPGTPV